MGVNAFGYLNCHIFQQTKVVACMAGFQGHLVGMPELPENLAFSYYQGVNGTRHFKKMLDGFQSFVQGNVFFDLVQGFRCKTGIGRFQQSDNEINIHRLMGIKNVCHPVAGAEVHKLF